MHEVSLDPGTQTVVVLGGGIAGLSAANALADAGFRVTVLEQSLHCGGAHRSHAIGPYTFDVGSIFYEATARLFDLAPDLRALCPQVQRRQRRIAPGGNLLHYPLEPRELLRGASGALALDLLDLLTSRLRVKRDGSLAAISRQRLGERIFRGTGLRSYITRFNHVPPEQVSESFFFHRMAFIERATRIGALLQMARRALFSRHSVADRPRPLLYVRPREGFAPLFERIERQLQAKGVTIQKGTGLLRIVHEGPSLRIETEKDALLTHSLVCTIPLDTAHRALFGKPSGLTSLSMTTLFVSAQWLNPDLGNVLFNFDTTGRWKRATLYSRIYPDPQIAREYMSVECTIAPGKSHDPQAVFDDFRAHLENLGLARDLVLEGSDEVHDCYPLYRPGTETRVDEVIARLSQAGIVCAGRQGRFEYLPTSSGVIRRVNEELERYGLLGPPDRPCRNASAERSAQATNG